MLKYLLTSVILLGASTQAADSKIVSTDPAEAGPDFTVQGEYAGDQAAAQVIALGDGKFRIVGYESGFPGSERSVKHQEADGQRVGEEVIFEKDKTRAVINGTTLTVTDAEGKKFTLKKTERKSPTLSAKPPEGAIMLFDGSNADAWKNGKIDKDGNLQGGVVSKQEFGDCQLHLEFRTPFMPAARGQGRGNSGVYFQDRYEVQVLDSFGLSGENNECGGIYTKHRPKVNMCFPPLSWQTYDADFTAAKWDADGKKTANAKLTVRHNGVVIHENAEVDSATTSAGRKDGPGPGPFQFQNHGNPVVYRNIWVVEKK